jgi:hypothetical protein
MSITGILASRIHRDRRAESMKSLVRQVQRSMLRASLTFVVKVVRPAEFSLVCRPLWGPGLGFSPLAKASRIVLVDSGVKSSYRETLDRLFSKVWSQT